MNDPDLVIPFIIGESTPFNMVLSDAEREVLYSKILALLNEGCNESDLKRLAETYFDELIRSDPGRI